MSRYRGEDSRFGGLVWGLMLITLGVAFLAQRQGFLPRDIFRDGWPVFVAILGVAEIAGARTAKKLGSGVTLLLMSGYFWVSITKYAGMNWSTSWPLALVAVGVGTVVETIASRFMPYRERDRVIVVEDGDHE